MQVAQTILEQLGGNRFIAMTGARNFVSDASRGRGSLMFKVGRNDKGVTHVRVTLNGNDLYDVAALKVRSLDVAQLDERYDVGFDSLRAEFTELTGLATSL
jgi:hypothetical protein